MKRKASSLTLRQLYELLAPHWKLRAGAVTRKRHGFDLDRWERLTGNPRVRSIDADALYLFREAMLAEGLGHETAHNTLNTVCACLRLARRQRLIAECPERPKRVRGPLRRGTPPDLVTFARFCQLAIDMEERGELPAPSEVYWVRTFLALGYFTALRRHDLLSLEWGQLSADALQVVAHKTGKTQIIPVHQALASVLEERREWCDGSRVLPVSVATVERTLKLVSRAVGGQAIRSQMIRKVSARAWERAHPGAGALILGHTLPGATAFYLDAPEILRHACPKLTVPDVFAGSQAAGESPDPAVGIAPDFASFSISTDDLRGF